MYSRFLIGFVLSVVLFGQRPPAARTATIEERTAGLQKLDGYFPLYWDEKAGNLLLEIPRFDTPFLYSTGLAAGLGSNDIGLDRGMGGQGRLVTFDSALALLHPDVAELVRETV